MTILITDAEKNCFLKKQPESRVEAIRGWRRGLAPDLSTLLSVLDEMRLETMVVRMEGSGKSEVGEKHQGEMVLFAIVSKTEFRAGSLSKSCT